MTNETHAPLPEGAPRNAFIAGLLSLVLLAIYFITPAGQVTLYGSILAGLAGVVLGIVALRKRQFVGLSVVALIMGAIGFLAGMAIVLFALVFVGAIG